MTHSEHREIRCHLNSRRYDEILQTFRKNGVSYIKRVLKDLPNYEALRLAPVLFLLSNSERRKISCHILFRALDGGVAVGKYSDLFRMFGADVQKRVMLKYAEIVVPGCKADPKADFSYDYLYLLLFSDELKLSISTELLRIGFRTKNSKVLEAVYEYLS